MRKRLNLEVSQLHTVVPHNPPQCNCMRFIKGEQLHDRCLETFSENAGRESNNEDGWLPVVSNVETSICEEAYNYA